MLKVGRQVTDSPAAKLFLAWPRTAAFAAHSMRRAFLTDRQLCPDIPTQPTTPSLIASVLVDEVALAFMPSIGSHVDRAQLTRVREETDAAIAFFRTNGWLDDPVG